MIDAMERAPLTLGFFRALALRVADALLATSVGGSLSRCAHEPSKYRALLSDSETVSSLPRELRDELEQLAEARPDVEAVRRWLQLPQDLAVALDCGLVVAIDELQELVTLASKRFEPFPIMRAIWQHHDRVAYVICGSAPSMLRELVTARHSPFFQHFHLLEVGPFERNAAVTLLLESAPRDRPIPEPVASRVVDVVGGNPFYLQLVGEALVSTEPPYDDEALKPVLQQLLFSRTGRLSLYFENEYVKLVGRATTAAATLQALAEHAPLSLTDVARRIGASTASTARYLDRLGDAIDRDDSRRYSLADPLFATWLRWRSPGGTVVPMTIIGDQAELGVARRLAALGFDLVYQSRASGGAFDLLAIRGPQQLGIQVKRSPLPLRFKKRAWNRMEADARRWGWRWIVASVDPDGTVHLLDPAASQRGREIRLGEDAAIDSLLRWLDVPAAAD